MKLLDHVNLEMLTKIVRAKLVRRKSSFLHVVSVTQNRWLHHEHAIRFVTHKTSYSLNDIIIIMIGIVVGTR